MPFASYSLLCIMLAISGDKISPITEPSDIPMGIRYADLTLSNDGKWIFCVRETHIKDKEAQNEIVAVSTISSETIVLASGRDFYSSPRPNPISNQICWSEWDHPNMPWDGNELYIADFDSQKISNELANDSLNQIENKKVVRKSTNKKEPEYYMDRIPLTKEKLKNSNQMIMEAYFQAGTIYKSYLNESKKATNLFTTLINTYPKNNNYTPLTLFNLYTIYKELDKNNKAAKCKKELLSNFPQSRYSKILNDTSYLVKIEEEKQKSLEHYAITLELYKNQNFHQVIVECDSLVTINTNKELIPKYDLLKALAIGKIDSTNFRKQLQKISKKYPNSEVKIKAEEIISLLDNPEKMIKINQEIERGTPYIFDKNEEHYFIIITPKKNTDVNFIKTLLSDYHSNNYSIETFEISAVIFGKDQHLIMVKTFDGYKRAAAYYNTFTNASKLNNELLKTQNKKLLISVNNFKYFFKNQDLEKYDKFFSNNYFREILN